MEMLRRVEGEDGLALKAQRSTSTLYSAAPPLPAIRDMPLPPDQTAAPPSSTAHFLLLPLFTPSSQSGNSYRLRRSHSALLLLVQLSVSFSSPALHPSSPAFHGSPRVTYALPFHIIHLPAAPFGLQFHCVAPDEQAPG
jgi:hypothetical protein